MDLPEYAIEARGLTKTYPATKTTPEMKALRGLDLAIPRGSIFGLLGPNGAGKSTFINILAGLCRKTSGTVAIWGRDIDRDSRDARAAIGVVPQEIAADPFFTPREALDVAAGMYAVPPAQRRTAELLAAMGLSDKANAYVRQLSGGMKRRLMVAKAMVHHPPVLILDEPTETLLRRLDTRNVVVTPSEPVGSAPELTGFETKLRGGGSFQVTYRTGQSSVEQVLAAVRQAGVAIRDLSTEDPDLEDVFVALTYGDPNAADPTRD
jgi:ABC-2 type transport system ATP-binding protein